MRREFLLFVTATFTAWFAGCKDSEVLTAPVAPYLSMITLETSYKSGGQATVRLVNHSDYALSYGGCSPKLEVLTANGWVSEEEANSRPCLDNLQGVPALSEAHLNFQLPGNLAQGTYRVRLERVWVVRQYDPNDGLVPAQQLTTNVFAVHQ